MTGITIERVYNGYIVKPADNDCKDEPPGYIEVFEQGDTGCQCSGLAAALWAAIDTLGASGSKHGTCRIKVSCKCEEDG